MRLVFAQFCIAAVLGSSAAHADDFQMDVSFDDALRKLNEIPVSALGVAEIGYVYSSNGMCLNVDGTLSVPGTLLLEDTRSQYSKYFEVRRLPNNRVALRVVDNDDTVTKSDRQGVISIVIQAPSCAVYSIVEIEDVEFLRVESIDGFAKLSDWIAANG